MVIVDPPLANFCGVLILNNFSSMRVIILFDSCLVVEAVKIRVIRVDYQLVTLTLEPAEVLGCRR